MLHLLNYLRQLEHTVSQLLIYQNLRFMVVLQVHFFGLQLAINTISNLIINWGIINGTALFSFPHAYSNNYSIAYAVHATSAVSSTTITGFNCTSLAGVYANQPNATNYKSSIIAIGN